jgi:putative transposase
MHPRAGAQGTGRLHRWRRNSAQDWRDLLLDLKRRGLDVPPRLAIAVGALGFWKAAGEVWPKTREQRCWVHKTANVLAKLPKSQQPKAKRALQEIWMAETKAAAELAFDAFVESYALKYAKAADCLRKDRDTLLAFYDFPAEHWKHLRTTDEMDKRFFHDRDDCRNRVRPFFCSAAPRAILPSRPSISQPPRAGAVKAGRVCGHRKAWP